MKSLCLSLIIVVLHSTFIQAQDKIPTLDKSPMDMSYCPDNYPMLKVQSNNTEPLIARIIYSRPSKNGRKIFGELLEYGKVWRVGANESTEIEFFKDVYVNKTKIKKGRYTLYALPYEDKWTMIINKEIDTWGAFIYDQKKDVVRVDVPVQLLQDSIEACSIYFVKNNNKISMFIMWDNIKVVFPISLTK